MSNATTARVKITPVSYNMSNMSNIMSNILYNMSNVTTARVKITPVSYKYE